MCGSFNQIKARAKVARFGGKLFSPHKISHVGGSVNALIWTVWPQRKSCFNAFSNHNIIEKAMCVFLWGQKSGLRFFLIYFVQLESEGFWFIVIQYESTPAQRSLITFPQKRLKNYCLFLLVLAPSCGSDTLAVIFNCAWLVSHFGTSKVQPWSISNPVSSWYRLPPPENWYVNGFIFTLDSLMVNLTWWNTTAF